MPPRVQGNLPPMELNRVGESAPRFADASPTVPNRLAEWRALVCKSLGRAGLSQKAAAADLGVTESALSKQLAGAEHLSFWRMASLPPEFWRELILQVAEFHDLTIGSTQQDAEDAAVGRLVREVVGRCR